MNKSTSHVILNIQKRKGMGLDRPLLPIELAGYIFFLPFFSSSSSSLGKGDRKCLINVLEKT